MAETAQMLTEYLMGQATQALASPEAQAQLGNMFKSMFDTPETREILLAIAETRLMVRELRAAILRVDGMLQEQQLQLAKIAAQQKPLQWPPDGQLVGAGHR